MLKGLETANVFSSPSTTTVNLATMPAPWTILGSLTLSVSFQSRRRTQLELCRLKSLSPRNTEGVVENPGRELIVTQFPMLQSSETSICVNPLACDESTSQSKFTRCPGEKCEPGRRTAEPGAIKPCKWTHMGRT